MDRPIDSKEIGDRMQELQVTFTRSNGNLNCTGEAEGLGRGLCVLQAEKRDAGSAGVAEQEVL